MSEPIPSVEPRPTRRDVAKLAKVSGTTVSRVLGGRPDECVRGGGNPSRKVIAEGVTEVKGAEDIVLLSGGVGGPGDFFLRVARTKA